MRRCAYFYLIEYDCNYKIVLTVHDFKYVSDWIVCRNVDGYSLLLKYKMCGTPDLYFICWVDKMIIIYGSKCVIAYGTSYRMWLDFQGSTIKKSESIL